MCNTIDNHRPGSRGIAILVNIQDAVGELGGSGAFVVFLKDTEKRGDRGPENGG